MTERALKSRSLSSKLEALSRAMVARSGTKSWIAEAERMWDLEERVEIGYQRCCLRRPRAR